jgi:type III secretion protein V
VSLLSRFRIGPQPFGRPRGIADLLLGALMVSVVGLMLVPLPPSLLDLLIAANLVTAVTVVLVTLYVSDPLKIAAFPTLLLLTTLVRLALNVSSTRLILLNADAGAVIRSFGNFVVAGNYIVGAVIFLILTIIQLVVIARGSERVAEVGARFTLDAMPGKQMAIDGAQRAGTLDAQGAERRRRALDRTSQFYGAMDGAMKFVKGDVIASLMITAINIGGGLAIGMGQRDLALGDAARVYGLLTIGDGLVTQIPALLLATAAGVLVTRVASEHGETALGEDLGRQLLGVPRALRTAALFVGVLALVPGLPLWPFMVMGAALLGISFIAPEPPDAKSPGASESLDEGFVPIVTSWSFHVGAAWGTGERASLRRALQALRERLFAELGLPLPEPRIEASAALAPAGIALCIHERPVTPAIPLTTEPGALETAASVAHGAEPFLRSAAHELLGMTEVKQLLERLEERRPGLVREVIPTRISLAELTAVLRGLVAEGVSIRDLPAILEGVSLIPTDVTDAPARIERLRRHLARQITRSIASDAGAVAAIVLDRTIEDTIEDAIVTTDRGRTLALAPAMLRDIREPILEAAQAHPEAILVTRAEIRPFVRELLGAALPELRVLSPQELAPEARLAVMATVRPT